MKRMYSLCAALFCAAGMFSQNPPATIGAYEYDANKAIVKWVTPDAQSQQLKYDDNTAESLVGLVPTTSIGNIFTPTSGGTVVSADIYVVPNPKQTVVKGVTVTVSVWVEEGESYYRRGTSQAFELQDTEGWQTVSLPMVDYTSKFIVLIDAPDTDDPTNWIGVDTNGPNATVDPEKNVGVMLENTAQGAKMYYFYTAYGFYEDGQGTGAVPLVRANVLTTGTVANAPKGMSSRTLQVLDPTQPQQLNKSLRMPASLIEEKSLERNVQQYRYDMPASKVCAPLLTSALRQAQASYEYDVYRLKVTDKGDESKWEALTPFYVTEMTYEDTEWGTCEQNTVYMYAVKTVSGGVSSAPAFSNELKRGYDYDVSILKAISPFVQQDGAALTISLANEGYKKVELSDLTFDVTINGQTQQISGLQGDALDYAQYYPELTLGELQTMDPEMDYYFTVKVNMPNDADLSNNEVSWSIKARGILEDFESYSDFATDFTPWISKDVDGLPIITLTLTSSDGTKEDLSFPGYDSPKGFFIYNPASTTPTSTNVKYMTPPSGKKYAISFAVAEGPNKVNDWLISPVYQLGEHPSFRFFAASYSGNVKCNILVSTGGTEVSDFTVLPTGSKITMKEDWNEYSFDLSNYANQNVRLAVQVVYNDLLFMLDDVEVYANSGLGIEENNAQIAENIAYVFGGKLMLNYKSAREVSVYNMMGQLVYAAALTEAGNKTVDIHSGAYIVKYTDMNSNVKTIKVIK